MRDLNDLKIFVRVIELGSFAKAAKDLGVSKSSVSRKIGNLEQQLGVALIVRTTRQIGITDIGEIYLNTCYRVLDELAEADRLARVYSTAPSGTLTIHASVATGQYLLAEYLLEFLALYPNVSVHVKLDNQRVNLIDAGVDVAIRIGDLPDSSLISRRLGILTFGTYASQAYLDQRGHPEHPRDLFEHDCLRMSDLPDAEQWRLQRGAVIETVAPPDRVNVNDFGTLYKLVENDAGIAVFPEQVMRNELQKLIRVLPDWSMRTVTFYALYPSHAVGASKISAFVEFLSQKLRHVLTP